MQEIKLIEKEKEEFEKTVDEWGHTYNILILWMGYSDGLYRALIRRAPKTAGVF